MKCENCENEHDGKFGSGRFCSTKCSKSFSTKNKRVEINEKVSRKLKGLKCGKPFKKGYDSRRYVFSTEVSRKINRTRRKKIEIDVLEGLFENLSKRSQRKRILIEQKNCCLKCKMFEWMGEKLVLELDHIDGNTENNVRENLRLLCPNCHSQTPTWRKKKNKKTT